MRLSGGDCKANAVVDVRISLWVMYDSHPTSHAHWEIFQTPLVFDSQHKRDVDRQTDRCK